ncbi:methyl-CpG-binding domain-containing protein 5-like [Actinidia eriantha]|uniref:methyl-CpG-binding domain-containing protein 5-like n=1 Tax=Actinidia eriantha TaxID=165200 RepID=UPI00258A8666|nr:methyl-CpG-binding domain-containing protein 5-like [Actinidia eriantha]XP_057471582.1 methyl-CpG-binding domain-containing protein 5-like [Actinidia eriantha]XP_057471583.1 methyl-CpG-binding domain-containing protein 5-like [Actinidia eriantha]XP_057471584.1 methyl-CpG-binding domain-containing protein 5-like [Actinidia eriantha]XP_057471585.1 methyl-CpG-binding domain-containing protein 5-like [Actinidia eriantha]XP_057471586.1 methyl-CpG-binding domain-containing protein 5-like [Actinid
MATNEGQEDPMSIGPPGWRVEARPRNNEKYLGKIDWFYYEPGTEKQYRSRKSAWDRYFEVMSAYGEFKDSQGPEVGPSQSKAQKPNMKKLMRMKMKTASFDVVNLPDSVTWKLTDAENDNWAPYVGNEMVTKAQQKLWEETFELAMLWEDWPGHGVNAEQKDEANQGENAGTME